MRMVVFDRATGKGQALVNPGQVTSVLAADPGQCLIRFAVAEGGVMVAGEIDQVRLLLNEGLRS